MNSSFTLNPMSMGTPEEIIDLFERMTEVSLSLEQREASTRIIRSLPDDSAILDFVNACNIELARELGITSEQLEAIGPLLVALQGFVGDTEESYSSYWS